MYINQQRKKLKTCPSLQRHNSKIHKHTLRRFKFRKHIQTLYELLSHILPVLYNKATVQENIVQALLATPPQAQVFCSQPRTRIDPFPNHIFPQLRPLKRSIQIAKTSKQMEPIHWQSGIRSNRPFEQIFQQPQYNEFTPPRRRSQSLPCPAACQRQIPTQYFLEQATFYAENFGPDPFATEPERTTPGPIKAIIASLFDTLSKISVPYLEIFTTLVASLLALGRFAGFWGFWYPVKLICEVVGTVEWEVFIAMAVANQVVKFLPGMRVELLADGGRVDRPVYTIFVKGGRAIGTGPVMTEMC